MVSRVIRSMYMLESTWKIRTKLFDRILYLERFFFILTCPERIRKNSGQMENKREGNWSEHVEKFVDRIFPIELYSLSSIVELEPESISLEAISV